MTNQNEARGIIAAKSAQLEKVLRKAGANGSGLKELSASVDYLFDDSSIARIRKIYELRNKAMHEHEFCIDQRVLDGYTANVDAVINILEPRDEPGIEHIRRVRATGNVDQAAYDWALAEGERALAASLRSSEVTAGELSDKSIVSQSQVETEASKIKSSKPKLLSAEQRERLAFENSTKQSAQSKPNVSSVPSAFKEAAQDALIKVAVKGVLSALKII